MVLGRGYDLLLELWEGAGSIWGEDKGKDVAAVSHPELTAQNFLAHFPMPFINSQMTQDSPYAISLKS